MDGGIFLRTKQETMVLFQLSVDVMTGEPSADGAISTWTRDLGVFSSIEKAEKMIADYVRKCGVYDSIFGFFLREKMLDDSLHEPWNVVSEFKSVRTYLGDGRFHCASVCDNVGEVPFCGRSPDEVPFKVGDYVYVRKAHEVVPALIVALPFAKGAGMTGDYTDDAYTAYFIGYGHDHPFVPYVLPFIGNPSDAIKLALQQELERGV